MDDFDETQDSAEGNVVEPENTEPERTERELEESREARFIAEFSQFYLEIVAGLRAPEQLARWLGDTNFLSMHDARVRQARAREFLKLGDVAPTIRIIKVAFFPSRAGCRNAVVIFKWAGLTRAMTVVSSSSNHRQRFLTVDIVGA
jgi:hypothetical protein